MPRLYSRCKTDLNKVRIKEMEGYKIYEQKTDIDNFLNILLNNKDKLFIMYNSDDPLNVNKELFDKAKIFDIVITPCKDTIHLYKLYSNVKTVLFGPMGYDSNLFNSNINVESDEFRLNRTV